MPIPCTPCLAALTPDAVRIGSHQSVAGGLELAVEAARRDGCEALQIFTRNQNRWRPKSLDEEAVGRFCDALEKWGVPRERVMAHGSYLINLAARDRSIRRRSLTALADELRRCTRLGIPHLVVHAGAHVGRGEVRAIEMVSRGMAEALERTADAPRPATLLIENTAGQGTVLGHSFAQLRDLLERLAETGRAGLCFDTQHAFAAGYDLSTPEGYRATFEELDRLVGLDQVRAFHLNDSKTALGSRVDRHERIGAGRIGRPCFRLLMNDRRLAEMPGVLELAPPYPPELAKLRRLSDGLATPRRRPPPP